MKPSDILKDVRSSRVKTVFIDTDAFNEIDDQFAILYAMSATDRVKVIGLSAAPFHNVNAAESGEGMEKSFEELLRLRACFDDERAEVPVYRGSVSTITETGLPDRSDAAYAIIEAAHAVPDGDVLYVPALGACTNVASALMLDPSIAEKICVMWLACSDFKQKPFRGEFNLYGDVKAGQILFESGVNQILCPAFDVTVKMKTRRSELLTLGGVNARTRYLVSLTERSGGTEDWETIIWDAAAPATLCNPACATVEMFPSTPRLVYDEKNQLTYADVSDGRPMLMLTDIDRDKAFADLIRTIRGE